MQRSYYLLFLLLFATSTAQAQTTPPRHNTSHRLQLIAGWTYVHTYQWSQPTTVTAGFPPAFPKPYHAVWASIAYDYLFTRRPYLPHAYLSVGGAFKGFGIRGDGRRSAAFPNFSCGLPLLLGYYRPLKRRWRKKALRIAAGVEAGTNLVPRFVGPTHFYLDAVVDAALVAQRFQVGARFHVGLLTHCARRSPYAARQLRASVYLGFTLLQPDARVIHSPPIW